MPPNTTRTLTGCLGSHTNAFLLSAKGRGFSFLDFERNKDKVLFSERIREISFLLGAKRNKSGRGNFPSGVPTEKSFDGVFFPLGTPKLLIPPQTKYLERAEHSPPYLRGEKGNVNKRTSPIWKRNTSKKRLRQ